MAVMTGTASTSLSGGIWSKGRMISRCIFLAISERAAPAMDTTLREACNTAAS